MATPIFSTESASISIVDLPADCFLVHATNCIAQWGAGIAAELAHVFPAACVEYKRYCNAAKASPSARWPPRSLAGQCLIIPPQQADVDAGAPRIHIVCLFTSYGFGSPNERTGKPGRDAQGKILTQSDASLKEFRRQLEAMAEERGPGREAIVYSPMFNSGAFKVPWDRTEALIESSFRGWGGRWVVMTPP